MSRKPQKRSPIDTDEYRRLRAEWDSKLKESGFEDIEMIDKRTGLPGDRLRGVSPGDLRRSSHRIRHVRDTERFYALCRAHLHEIPKHLKLHRKIWGMFSEGARYSEIYRALKEEMGDEAPKKGFVTRFIKRTIVDLQVEALRPEGPLEESEQEIWGASQGWQA